MCQMEEVKGMFCTCTNEHSGIEIGRISSSNAESISLFYGAF
jgi:hypothetical protein